MAIYLTALVVSTAAFSVALAFVASRRDFGLPSLIVPLPCQADVLYEQLNYICVNNEVTCLPGWTNAHNYCRDPACPEGCADGRGICTKPNVCHCRAGYYGHACQNCVPLPGCMHGSCERSYECNCREGWKGIYCSRAICREGCHDEYGFCDRPNDCVCHMGYRGTNCTDCKLLPGCVHGHCNRPLECLCDEGWTGEFCDEPICRQNCHPIFGSCENPGECVCRNGYKGDHCNECREYPGCVHGNCSEPWTCNCEAGWTGLKCDVKLPPGFGDGGRGRPTSGGNTHLLNGHGRGNHQYWSGK